MGALVIGGALVTGVYAYAYQRGAAAERVATLERSVELLRERTRTDETVHAMDDAELCLALGGRMLDGTCQ